ncbi:LysR family transcriptional regulator [Methylophilus sp. QUAN]|uniref:LysR family transcriptional regulator n=1 Tax=Methylophilus sp. QUAN TaxID=2781020 RepID=UPI0018905ED2|nr:LysR family transcriptional regulator [Methylophilus sp. QUAN]MBF4991982.1 LysR family transcriptional regulator [Methylophilus sp. QUAN]
MKRNLNDLLAFVTVAREKSFTKAAAKLGVTQSALSQTMRGLEERLDIRLLTRTTRGVSTTEAGQRLVDAIGYRFDDIQTELDALTALRDKPAGTVRITCGETSLRSILLPKLAPLLEEYPDINIEFDVDLGLVNIVSERFDAGVRLGATLDKDMIAIPIGPALRFVVAASPSYFAKHPPPKSPQELTTHNCINQRMETSGGLYVWDFVKDSQQLNVRVNGQLIFNTVYPQIDAAIAGLGIVLLPEDEIEEPLREGKLVKVLEDWCPTFGGYHLYYPSRRQPSPAFTLVLNALRLK